MNKNDITQREAERMVRMGVYDTIEEAWSEAEAVCDGSDAYEILEKDYSDFDEEEED